MFKDLSGSGGRKLENHLEILEFLEIMEKFPSLPDTDQ